MLILTGENIKNDSDDKILDRLISDLSDGNKDSLGVIYEKTKTSVYGYALSIVKNRADAEDVMHDAYLSVYSSAASYSSSGKPMAWILTIVKNLCLSKLRANSIRSHEQIDDYSEFIASNDSLAADEKLILAESLGKLSDNEREIVMLHALSGFKHREIAEYMNLPLATVLSKYSRAVKKLKKALCEGGTSCEKQ